MEKTTQAAQIVGYVQLALIARIAGIEAVSLIEAVRALKVRAVRDSAPVPKEAAEAITLTEWVTAQGLKRCWVMIPNGGHLAGNVGTRAAVMHKMKRQGFYVGASDYFLAMPQRGYHGLWIELKRKRGGVVSPDQKAFQIEMAGMGYAVAVCKGFEEARRAINDYFGGELGKPIETGGEHAT